MSDLKSMSCEACKAGAPLAAAEEKAQWMRQLPDWKIIERNGEERLERAFKFKNFTEALNFTNRVAAAAEEQDHHPALLTEWGKVTVTWWTHKIGGLHRNDFIMAALTSALADARATPNDTPGVEF